jgi:DNA-3-methyladenine glycosylase II
VVEVSDGARNTIDQTVALEPPIDLAASLRPFGRWGDDGIDRWDGTTLVRTLTIDEDGVIPFAARAVGDASNPALNVVATAGAPHHPRRMAELIRATFVAHPPELADLGAADGRVARLLGLYRGIVPVLVPDPFIALIRSISAQQVNLRWASTVRRRLAERYGTRHEVGSEFVYSLEPEPLAAASIEELRSLQLTTAKARSAIALAETAVAGELNRHELERMTDDELIVHLTRIRGIGRWSAEWFLARTLGRPRVVCGDLGVRKAVGLLYDLEGLPSEDEVRRLTEHWGAAATTVQTLVLHHLALSAGTPSPARHPPAGGSCRPGARGGRPGTTRQ